MDFKFSFEESLKGLGEDINKLTEEIISRAKQGIGLLAAQTHALLIQKAQEKLKSTRKTYVENLGMMSENDELWVVYLKKPAEWIEEGQEKGEMIDRILKGGKPAKINKKGHKYKVIPFEHSKKPSDMSLDQQRIASYAKSEIKRRGLDKPIMANGKPILGRAATLNLTEPGAPRGKFNQPLLSGLTIYQREAQRGNKTIIKRDVMTFRVISEEQKGSGLWYSKGYAGAHLFEEVAREVDKMWGEMVTKIIDEVKVVNQPTPSLGPKND